jgi:indole-3-glycerol phosphate synthase
MNKLQEICAKRLQDVEILKSQAKPFNFSLAPDVAGFRNALHESNNKPALIAEVKRASPSQGGIRPNLDPIQLAQTYEAGGASCLSVLTEPHYFQGSDDDFKQVHQSVKLPLIRKDFVVDQFQVDEARMLGASAILLIVAALSDHQITQLQSRAWELGMDVLVEVHDTEEAKRAVQSGATIIGVNNRNLKDLTIDLSTTELVFPLLPKQVIKVSESGIESHEDIQRVVQAGADAVLIGTAFSREPEPQNKIKSVMGW